MFAYIYDSVCECEEGTMRSNVKMEISLFIGHLEFFTACQTLVFDVVGLMINQTKKVQKSICMHMVYGLCHNITMDNGY